MLGLAATVVLSGCSLTQDIPSFWDDNESARAVDVFIAVSNINCSSHFVKNQFVDVGKQTQRLKHYARLKGSNDVTQLVDTFEQSLVTVTSKQTINVSYCRIKRDSLLKQSETIAKAILRRY